MFAIDFHSLLNGSSLEVDCLNNQKNSEISYHFMYSTKNDNSKLGIFYEPGLDLNSKFREDIRLS